MEFLCFSSTSCHFYSKDGKCCNLLITVKIECIIKQARQLNPMPEIQQTRNYKATVRAITGSVLDKEYNAATELLHS